MAPGIKGSSHTRYSLGSVRKDTMGSKYVGNCPKPKMSSKGGKKGK